MARENRAANRAKAKASSETATGQEFDELFESDITNVDDEDRPLDESDEIGGEEVTTEKEVEEGEVNAAGSETGEAGTPPAVKKEGEEEGKEATEEVTEAEKKPEAATEEKKVETKAEEKPAEAAPVAQPAPTPVVEEKAKETEAVKPLTDDEAAKLFSDWRNETESLLAQHHYRMSEKDVEEFNENPAAWVPKAMSRVYLDCISASFQQFVTYLPRMVDQVLDMKASTESRENEFFGAWPELKQHKDTVLRLGAAYRAQNPTASAEDFIKEVGAQACVALRITPPGMQAAAPKQPEVKAPFTPASQTPAPVPPKPKSNNPFETLAEEFSFEALDD